MAASGSESRGSELRLPQFNPIQLRLDRANYAFWRVLVLSAIRGQGLENFISPMAVVPMPLLPGASAGVMVPNPEYVDWIKRDQCLMSWLLSTVGESMLGHVVRCKSACEVWIGLEKAVYAQSKAQTMKFRAQLQSTKKGNLSVEDYFMKMRAIGDQLAAIGKPLDDDELLLHILDGFGPEYEAMVVNTMNRSELQDLQEVQLAFQAYEARIANQHSSFLEHSANVAYRGRGGAPYGAPGRGNGGMIGGNNVSGVGYGGSGAGYGRGAVKQNFGKVLLCQLCGRTGHVALKCFKRFDVHFTGVDAAASSGGGSGTTGQRAFVSEVAGTVDQDCVGGEGGNWCVDSGATTHITNDFQNLAVSTDYVGNEGLMVGNGHPYSQDSAEGESL